MVSLLLKYAWVFGIVATLINAMRRVVFGRRTLASTPEKLTEFPNAVAVIAILGAIPWLVMGIGILVGGPPSVLLYTRPQDLDPHVLAFYASVFLVEALFLVWVFVFRGAHVLSTHPTLLVFAKPGERLSATPATVRLLAVLAPALTLGLILLVAWLDMHVEAS